MARHETVTPGPRHRLLLAFAWLAVANLWLLAGTGWTVVLFRVREQQPDAWRLWSALGLNQLNLATENVLAVWYSSMLLLLVAVGAWVCFVVDRGRALRWGWLGIAGAFALLSLDELGAVHERLGALPALNPFGDTPHGWIYLLALPTAAAVGLVAAFAWTRARTSPATAALVTLGTMLFLTVPLQEELEVQMLSWTGSALAVALLEEGTELFGTLCFLAAVLAYARPRITLDQLRPAGGRAASRYWSGVAVMTIGLVAALVTSPTRAAYSQDALWVGSFFNAALVGLDADLAAGLAADTVEIRVIPAPPGESGTYRGRGALRGWIEQNQRDGLRLQQHAVQPEGNTVTWVGEARRGGVDLRTRTSVYVENGKVKLLTVDFAPPVEEVAAAAENWFPSALAMLAALVVVAFAARGGGRGPAGALAAVGVALSAYYGANVPAYTDWGAFDALRRGVHELLSAAVILTAVVWVVRERRTAVRAGALTWALGVSAALGIGGLYSAPIAFAAFVALGGALLAQAARPAEEPRAATSDLRDAAVGGATA